MKWIMERDALIAQTLAFVQSVTGRKDGFGRPDHAEASITTTTVELTTVLAVAQTLAAGEPLETVPPPQPAAAPPPRMTGEFRTEVQARVANFRKYQERFEREREEYCATTLAKLRAAIRDGASGPSAGT
jgi:hypothetical protein